MALFEGVCVWKRDFLGAIVPARCLRSCTASAFERLSQVLKTRGKASVGVLTTPTFCNSCSITQSAGDVTRSVTLSMLPNSFSFGIICARQRQFRRRWFYWWLVWPGEWFMTLESDTIAVVQAPHNFFAAAYSIIPSRRGKFCGLSLE